MNFGIQLEELSFFHLLGVKKTFNTRKFQNLLKKLMHFGVRGFVLTSLNPSVYSQRQCINVDGQKTCPRENNRRVPQGSILVPLVFIIDVIHLPKFVDFLLTICVRWCNK